MLNLDVIVVASAELDSINSAVITTEYLKQSGINIRGIIVNRYKEDDFMQEDNLKTNRKFNRYKSYFSSQRIRKKI